MQDYLKIWSQRDAFRRILAQIVRQLAKNGRLELDKCYIDATFVRARGSGQESGLMRHGKGAETQLMVDKQRIPVSVSQAVADEGGKGMVQQTLGFSDDELKPERLVGDKAYDSDPLDEVLAELGIEMISPQRKNRLLENKTQDG